MVSDPQAKTSGPAHTVLAAVFQVREAQLQVLLWERALDPFAGSWSLPGGELRRDETLEQSIRRHLAAKVDVRELSHLEQLETRGDPGRNPERWELTTAYLGLIPSDVDPALPPDTHWHPVGEPPQLAFDHEQIVLLARARLRAKLSYTNVGFALAPGTFSVSELRDLYRAALGHDVSATNLLRVLLRRKLLIPTGERRESGRAGGRPAAVYRFRVRSIEITDQFAVLRPPGVAVSS
jgi:ADP-ribose pyrophosphatase YjhB (NUDIX family)